MKKTYAAADEDTGNDLRPRRNARLRCPGEPEETDDEDHAAHHHGRQSLFGDDFLCLDELGCEDGLRLPRQGDTSGDHAYKDGDERQRRHAKLDPPVSFETERVREEDQVQDTVHQTDVDGHDDEDRLLCHHLRRLQTVLAHQVTELNRVFVELGVQGPVARLLTQASGFLLEDNGREGFLECE